MGRLGGMSILVDNLFPDDVETRCWCVYRSNVMYVRRGWDRLDVCVVTVAVVCEGGGWRGRVKYDGYM